MFAEIKLVKRFLGAKFGHGENIPDGIYAIPTKTSKGNAFMKYETKNNCSHGKNNFLLFWDEKLTKSWYDSRKPLFLRESSFNKAFRKLESCVEYI